MLQLQCSQLIVKIILKQSIHIWQTAVLLILWNFNWILANESSVSLLTWNEKTCCSSHTSMEFNVILRVTENAVYWRLAKMIHFSWDVSCPAVLQLFVVLMQDNYLWFYNNVLRNRCKPWDLFPACFWEADLTLISVSLTLHFCITALQKAWKELHIIYCNISEAICAICLSYWFLIGRPSPCVCSVFDLQMSSRHRLLHFEDTLSWRAVRLGQNRGRWHRCWNTDGDNLKSKWMDCVAEGCSTAEYQNFTHNEVNEKVV